MNLPENKKGPSSDRDSRKKLQSEQMWRFYAEPTKVIEVNMTVEKTNTSIIKIFNNKQ